MLHKFEVLNAMCEGGVVAVIRTSSKKEAVEISEACVEGLTLQWYPRL